MGYWLAADMSLSAKNLKCEKTLTQALLAATMFGGELKNDFERFDEKFESVLDGKSMIEANNADGVYLNCVDLDAYPSPETFDSLICEMSKSLVALFPECEVEAKYWDEYSVGGINAGMFAAKNGIVAAAYGTDNGLYDEPEECDDKKFVISGKLKYFEDREEFVEYIEDLGGSVTGSISSKTDFLICNNPNSKSSKIQKANELGIQIITELEFIKRFGYTDDFDIEDEDDCDGLDKLINQLNSQLSQNFDKYCVVQFPNYTVNWSGEGTFAVISAAKQTGDLERVMAAVEKKIITRAQLEGALEVAQAKQDNEISAALLQMMDMVGYDKTAELKLDDMN